MTSKLNWKFGHNKQGYPKSIPRRPTEIEITYQVSRMFEGYSFSFIITILNPLSFLIWTQTLLATEKAAFIDLSSIFFGIIHPSASEVRYLSPTMYEGFFPFISFLSLATLKTNIKIFILNGKLSN